MWMFLFPHFKFLLTHPVWDVTKFQILLTHWPAISTHTSRVGCDVVSTIFFLSCGISTHTSRVGCDSFASTSSQTFDKFLLTHPVWDVTLFLWIMIVRLRFLLTHPVWDVTDTTLLIPTRSTNFYSHIPCGMWQKGQTFTKVIEISTHTSRVGCDVITITGDTGNQISTHTSRVGCDPNPSPFYHFLPYFYSHIPCGMWLLLDSFRMNPVDFYSHIPCGMWQVVLTWTD